MFATIDRRHGHIEDTGRPGRRRQHACADRSNTTCYVQFNEAAMAEVKEIFDSPYPRILIGSE